MEPPLICGARDVAPSVCAALVVCSSVSICGICPRGEFASDLARDGIVKATTGRDGLPFEVYF